MLSREYYSMLRRWWASRAQKKTEVEGPSSQAAVRLEHARASVIFVTDRNDEHKASLEKRFGSKRLDPPLLSCGVLTYLPDRNRVDGDVFQGRIVPLPTELTTGELGCGNLVKSEMTQLGSSDLYLYVHGYLTDFDYAVRRGIGIVEDNQIRGVLVVWCWPSDFNTDSYPYDEVSSQWTQFHIQDFFSQMFRLQPDTELKIIAHSLGARIAQSLILELARTGRAARITSMIFAAPDEDQGRFKQNVDRTQSYVQGARLHDATLYAASNDRSLKISSFVHRSRGGSEVRAGTGGHDVILLTDHVESVDASALWNQLWHHDYLFTHPRAMKDYNQVLMHNLSAQARALPKRSRNGPDYWLLLE